MCGICGISSANISVNDRNIVKNMMDTLYHRGPDGDGISYGHDFVFGHRRLAIIDIDHGQQPIASENGRYTLTYNGEIYNYIELRDDLKKRGVNFRTNSDTEVLLQLLIHDGVKALDKLIGMYAFAFHDGETGQVILARDEFGIKPLYYTITDNGSLVFASEIKAILKHPSVKAVRSNDGLMHYLTFQLCLGDGTLFSGIKKLKPGFYILFNAKNTKDIKQQKYWDCEFKIDEVHTESYFLSKLDTLLEDSINLQLRSDVPLGTYLSGGVDSSLITAIAAGQSDNKISSYHGRFAEGNDYDESEYAKMVADSASAEYKEVVPTAKDFVSYLPKLIYHMDEPAAGPGLFPQYCVSKLASDNHVKVILGGQGGDEIFGGYARYVVGYLEQALKGAILETQEEGQHLVTLSSIIPNLPLLRQYVPMMKQFWKSGLFEPMDSRYFKLIDRSPNLAHMLESGVMSEVDKEKIFEDFKLEFNSPDTQSYINKMTYFDLKTLLPALLQVEDRMSMAVSLESRVPILDRRIVDLTTTIPPAMKFAGGKTKYLLKKISENKLPQEVVNRKDKMGFPVPLKEWMEKGIVRDFVSDTLLSKASKERGIFKPSALEMLIDKETKFGRELWGALCLELWHQIYIDKTMSFDKR